MRPKLPRLPRATRALVAFAAIVALTAGILAAPPGTDDASAQTTPALPGWLHTSGATIRTSTGKAYTIKAVAWFGMETASCAPDGLWTISLDQGLAEIASMGFNTIRLPFSNQCLAQATTSGIDATKNPALATMTPLQLMDTVVARARLYGLNIILDQHRPDSAAQSALWYTADFPETRWISDWKMLATRYRTARNVIGFDLHNEPHGAACWGCGVNALDWRAAATRAGNAVLKINPHVLIIVEGIDKKSSTSYYWWGGALASVVKKPVKLTVKHRVVYSPHDYPASVYPQPWFKAANYPRNLPGIWTKNWGYIDKKKIAPVLIGEFGTKLKTHSDKLWLKSLVKYIKANKLSFSYWSFNPDSGDTGGLVKADWTTKESAKLRYLKPLIGSGRSVAVLSGPVVPTPTPAPSTLTGQWQALDSWGIGTSTGGYNAQLVISTPTDVASWTATWPDTTTTSITSTWGMTCTLAIGISITCTGADYGATITGGYPLSAGLTVVSTTIPAPPVVTVK